ncbi:MAG TPA: hydroxymethylbilane synthase [Acidimicrobiales bacterium]|nr:hydroxymethylbilane synthase [Acidimicrobiales bacterium]
MPQTLRVATRGSALALWQAEHVVGMLQAVEPSLAVELVIVETHADRNPQTPIEQMGGKGVFAKEIQLAVLEERADITVHSAKDLPTTTPEGLVLAAVPPRWDPRDCMVGSTLADLPAGGVVATGSLRRRAQLAHVRPDLRFETLRGNVPTRVEKAGDFDAIVLACAGLDRLGLADKIAERLEPEVMLPQVGQAAIAVECRRNDYDIRPVVERIEHWATRHCVDAERGFLSELGGDCSLPAAAHATIAGDGLKVEGMISTVDGRTLLREEMTGPASAGAALGRSLANLLLHDKGGAVLLESAS